MRSAAYVAIPVALAVAVLAVAALLLPACGVAGLPWLDACPARADGGDAGRADALAARRAALEGEIASLRRRLAALPACPRVAAATPPAPEPPPAPPPPPEEVVAAEPPAARPPDLRPPPPPPPPPDEGIDEDRWRDRDVSLLEGCWNLDSDYTMVDGRTGAPRPVTSWTMCFDASGVGRETQSFAGGARCEGPVRGRFVGDRLEIDEMQDVPCSDGTRITRRRSRCSLVPGGRAACENFHPAIPDSPPVDIILRR
jgi:hypothetical protein